MISSIKKIIKKTLGLNKSKNRFKDSKTYWEKRYKTDGNSGAGSYGRLAIYKAEFLNNFVKSNNINTVIELGCGDGNQLKLASYPYYIGYDVSQEAIKICNKIFVNDTTKKFLEYEKDYTNKENSVVGELSMSLDVIYHLIEDDVFYDHLRNLFLASSRFVIIYASNYNKVLAPHVKSRKFSTWIDQNIDNKWKLKDRVVNKYPFDDKDPDNTSMSDFYIYEKVIN